MRGVTLLACMSLALAGCTTSWGGGEPSPFRLLPVAEGLEQPVAVAFDADGVGYIVQQNGTVLRWHNGTVERDPFLDLRSKLIPNEVRYWEQGLLDLEWHPRDSSRLYVSYTPERSDLLQSHRVVLEEYVRQEGGEVVPMGVLLDVHKVHPWHNGGHIEFGPDGHLYFSIGDGSTFGRCDRFNDPSGNAQDTGNLLGTIVRIAPTGHGNHTIPPDNPFVGDDAGRDEIWMYGMRNPFRFSFSADGAIWIGDVGAYSREEIDRVPAAEQPGANLGWPWFEGTKDITRCGSETHRALPAGGVDPDDFVRPVWEYPYPDDECAAVAAGVEHDGRVLPGLEGAFVFGDLCLERLWALHPDGDSWRVQELVRTADAAFVAVEETPDGGVLAVDWAGGRILELTTAENG